MVQKSLNRKIPNDFHTNKYKVVRQQKMSSYSQQRSTKIGVENKTRGLKLHQGYSSVSSNENETKDL